MTQICASVVRKQFEGAGHLAEITVRNNGSISYRTVAISTANPEVAGLLNAALVR
jgi:hypothetical protein